MMELLLDGCHGCPLLLPSNIAVLDELGTVLTGIEVLHVAVDAGSDIALGVYAVDRDDQLEEVDYILGAYLRAVVTDSDGAVIHQPELEWSVTGPGEVLSMFDDPLVSEVTSAQRSDLASWALHDDEVEQFTEAAVCITATIQTADGTVSRSAWLTPDEVTVSPGGDCDGRAGCACSSAPPEAGTSALGLLLGLLLGLALTLRRRRQQLSSSPGASGS